MPKLNMEKLKQFISDDGLTINLPVPLGSDTFFVSTSCGNFCCWQQPLFDEKFPDKDGHCGYNKPCHTVPWHIYVNKLGLHNMQSVLEQWGDRTFATMAEAESRMQEIIEANRKAMRDMGFYVQENGNGYVPKTEDEIRDDIETTKEIK